MPLTGTAPLNVLAAAAVMQRAGAGRFVMLPHGGRLYFLDDSWAVRVLSDDPDVTTVDSARALDAAFRDPDRAVILVRAESGLTPAVLETMGRRHGAPKTIFLEEMGGGS